MQNQDGICGWLSPDGSHFPCEEWGHRVEAEHIVEDILGEHLQTTPYVNYLLDTGWICFNTQHAMDTGEVGEVSEAQAAWICKHVRKMHKKYLSETLMTLVRLGFIDLPTMRYLIDLRNGEQNDIA